MIPGARQHVVLEVSCLVCSFLHATAGRSGHILWGDMVRGEINGVGDVRVSYLCVDVVGSDPTIIRAYTTEQISLRTSNVVYCLDCRIKILPGRLITHNQ